jgi:hypothetical protein
MIYMSDRVPMLVLFDNSQAFAVKVIIQMSAIDIVTLL